MQKNGTNRIVSDSSCNGQQDRGTPPLQPAAPIPTAIPASTPNQHERSRILELLAQSPGAERHQACGVTARPCSDCRRTAPLECIDPGNCGLTHFCRPCAATWRCRLWRRHLRYVREYHVWLERYPALASLHPNQEVAAALLLALRTMIRRDVLDFVWRRLGRELPDVVKQIVA
jgi:hypothetical protein